LVQWFQIGCGLLLEGHGEVIGVTILSGEDLVEISFSGDQFEILGGATLEFECGVSEGFTGCEAFSG